MKVKVKQDKTEAIKTGVDPVEQFEIDIDLKNLTPEQRAKLADIGSVINRPWAIAGTEAEVIAGLQGLIDTERQTKAAEEQQYDADLITARAWRPEIETRDCNSYGVDTIVYLPVTYNDSPIPYSRRVREICGILDDNIAEINPEVERLNAIEQNRVRPLIEAAKAEQAAKDAAAKATEEAAKQAEYAKRIETGIVEIPLSRGSRSEWGEPWISKLSTRNGKRPDYDFSAGSYDAAGEILSIPCKPGEIIAYGQKNYKKAKRTIHNVRKMESDGRLVQA